MIARYTDKIGRRTDKIERRSNIGNGVLLDNVNDAINIGKPFDQINLTAADPAFTMFFVFRFRYKNSLTFLTSQTDNSVLVGGPNTASRLDIRIESDGVSKGRLFFVIQRDDIVNPLQSVGLKSGYVLEDNKIYTVAWTVMDNQAANNRHYLNGKPLGNASSRLFTTDYFPSTSGVGANFRYIGTNSNNPGATPSNHTFYNASFWKRALSTSEIQTLHDNAGDCNALANQSDLRAWYDFNQNRGTLLPDVSGNGFNADLLNFNMRTDYGGGGWVDEQNNTAR